ncbi:hypothetical protein BDZ91DRAFT_711911 [Kalaharituber pfeilii]|nr:hypothetical protein BDZ91DRAFT_711911 [Kalaharituber pfeilii]
MHKLSFIYSSRLLFLSFLLVILFLFLKPSRALDISYIYTVLFCLVLFFLVFWLAGRL